MTEYIVPGSGIVIDTYNAEIIIPGFGIYVQQTAPSSATNLKINIGDDFKDVAGLQVNIGDAWKEVAGMQINIGDAWETIF